MPPVRPKACASPSTSRSSDRRCPARSRPHRTCPRLARRGLGHPGHRISTNDSRPGSQLFVGDRVLVDRGGAPQPGPVRRALRRRRRPQRGRGAAQSGPGGGTAGRRARQTRLFVHELIGAEVRDRHGTVHRPRRRGRGESRARPARARRRRARSDGVRRVPRTRRRRDRPARRTVRPVTFRASTCSRSFPEYLAAPLTVSLVGSARESGLLDVRLHDPRDLHDRQAPRRRRRAVRRRRGHGDDARSRCSRRSRPPQPPRPLLPALGERATLRPDASRASWPRATGFSLICGRYEGVDQRVADHLLRRRAVGRRLRTGRGRGGRARRDRGRRPSGAGRARQRRLAGRGVVQRIAARVPAVHPAGGVPRLGSARGAAVGRSRPDRALARGASRCGGPGPGGRISCRSTRPRRALWPSSPTDQPPG